MSVLVSPGVVLYVVLVSGLLGVAAGAFEELARAARMQARWIWLAVGVASVAVAIDATSTRPADPGPSTDPSFSLSADPSPDTRVAPGVGVAAWAPAFVPPAARRLRSFLQRALPEAPRLWLIASIATLIAALTALARLCFRARRWAPARIQGEMVLVSRDFGPAVVGVVRGRIVVPDGLLRSASPGEISLILEHEREHQRARDVTLLAGFGALLVLTPWNPVLWYVGRRLARAVELDCDRRLLRAGCDPARYGRLLVDSAARGRWPGALAAAFGGRPLLRSRIENLVPSKPTRVGAGVRVAAVVGIAAAACTIPSPATPIEEGPASDVVVDGKVANLHELSRALADAAEAPGVEGAQGVIALSARPGVRGWPTRVRVDATVGPSVTAGAVAAAEEVARRTRLVTAAGGPPEGWVPMWVVYLGHQVEAHVVRGGMYREKGLPEDRRSLERHMEALWQLNGPRIFGVDFAHTMAAADRPGARSAAGVGLGRALESLASRWLGLPADGPVHDAASRGSGGQGRGGDAG